MLGTSYNSEALIPYLVSLTMQYYYGTLHELTATVCIAPRLAQL